MNNPFLHLELQTQDRERARAFYQALFAWHFRELAGTEYTMIDAGPGVSAGITRAKSSASSEWIPFIQVDDVHRGAERIRSLGGTIIKGPSEASGYGWYCVADDPTGARFGLWKPEIREGS